MKKGIMEITLELLSSQPVRIALYIIVVGYIAKVMYLGGTVIGSLLSQ